MDDEELARYFGEMARKLSGVPMVADALDTLVHVAIDVLACDHVSISHRRGRALLSAASDDDVGLLLDAIQTDRQQGPCLDAVRLGRSVCAADIVNDGRWPEYGPRAHDLTGVSSSFAADLRGPDGRVIGPLNLFSNVTNYFRDDERQAARIAILAAHASAALHAALEREQLHEALASRDLIGQAKGILMAQDRIDAASAFDVLVEESQRTNVRLHEVARRVVSRNRAAASPATD